MKVLNVPMLRALRFGPVALAASLLVACGGGSSGGGSPTGTIGGTAAVGAAMANASVQITCKNGSGSATTNSNGAYSATFRFDGPCVISATGGSTSIHSLASASGTFNVTPLTELLLDYIATSQGTTLSALLAGVSSNATYQAALTNSALIAKGENAIVQIIKQLYGVTLSSSSFLTVSFTPGQPGPDADLDTLQSLNAFNSDGTPSSALMAAVVAAATSGSVGSGNTGGSGATGGVGSGT